MAATQPDDPRPARPGEEIDPAPLAAFLGPRVDGFAGPLEVLQFPSGHSNLTYLVRAGARELVLRRPPFGSTVKTAHDVLREHKVLSRLSAVYPLAPKPLAACMDAAVIGAPFYVMERARGAILRGSRPPAGVTIAPETMRQTALALVDHLAELHAVDWRAAGLTDLGHPEGYVERQVRGWSERYQKARTDDLPEVERAASWLCAHPPREAGASLVHGDYKYDNLVLDPANLARVSAVLDWEMATVGCPLMDLGTSLGYWTLPDDPPAHRALPLGPTLLPGNPTRAEVVARYEKASGRSVADPLFYYVYGLFKVAVIAQQIYVRWKKGLTKDERFGAMIHAVRALGASAARAIERGRIERLAD